jgi:hydroxymethylpyrimidine pyrophosphatase-like HAD family hydrolase
MKFTVLALDYDGTIALEGRLDPEVKSAIAEVRSRGVAVALVTGRILSELRTVAGSLDFVDCVVAENGAVLSFANGSSRTLGQPPPPIFFDELRRAKIAFRSGQCVVEASANDAPQVLEILRKLELPLLLAFNRGQLMILPQAISKGPGLHEALTMLRLSPHNAIAIGDAENDHGLLAAAEYGVAVSWGSRALQAGADEVLQGEGPKSVANYIRKVAKDMRLPPERVDRHRLNLGTINDGSALLLGVRGRNLLICGDPRSGKSWAAGLICEQLVLQGYSTCVIDAEGDYRTLESLPGVVVFGGESPPPELPELARVLRHPSMSAVVDLSHSRYRAKVEYMNSLLPMLASLRRATGLPHRILVDEAHYFLHEPNVREQVDFDLGAYTFVTYRLSDLHPDIRNAVECVIVKRTTDPREIETLLSMAGTACALPEWNSIFTSLAVDEAVLLPGVDEVGGKLHRFRLSTRATGHVRHRAKYVDLQLSAGQGFVFTDNGVPVGDAALTLGEFVQRLRTLPTSVLDGHARRGDFSHWVADIFHDHVLASDVRKVEQRYRLGHHRDLYNALAETIEDRYQISRNDDKASERVLASSTGEN